MIDRGRDASSFSFTSIARKNWNKYGFINNNFKHQPSAISIQIQIVSDWKEQTVFMHFLPDHWELGVQTFWKSMSKYRSNTVQIHTVQIPFNYRSGERWQVVPDTLSQSSKQAVGLLHARSCSSQKKTPLYMRLGVSMVHTVEDESVARRRCSKNDSPSKQAHVPSRFQQNSSDSSDCWSSHMASQKTINSSDLRRHWVYDQRESPTIP